MTFYPEDDKAVDVDALQAGIKGHVFVAGYNDGTSRLFDLRSYGQCQRFEVTEKGVNAVALSKSGSILFTAQGKQGEVFMWDTLSGKKIKALTALEQGHLSTVSCRSMRADGKALCTGSHDKSLRVWG